MSSKHVLPWGRLSPFPAVTRIFSIPDRATGGVLTPTASGFGLPGVGVVEREPSAGCEGVEEWDREESRDDDESLSSAHDKREGSAMSALSYTIGQRDEVYVYAEDTRRQRATTTGIQAVRSESGIVWRRTALLTLPELPRHAGRLGLASGGRMSRRRKLVARVCDLGRPIELRGAGLEAPGVQ